MIHLILLDTINQCIELLETNFQSNDKIQELKENMVKALFESLRVSRETNNYVVLRYFLYKNGKIQYYFRFFEYQCQKEQIGVDFTRPPQTVDEIDVDFDKERRSAKDPKAQSTD